jgi:hypothetical protein
MAGLEKLKEKSIYQVHARILLFLYEKLGFMTIGPTFEVEHVGTHYKMYKKL